MLLSNMRGAAFNDDDSDGVLENPQEPLQQTSKPKSDVQPTIIRRASFGDDNGGGIPETPREPCIQPSTTRGTSFADAVAVLRNLMSPRQPFAEPRAVRPKRGLRLSNMRGSSFRGDHAADKAGGMPDEPHQHTQRHSEPHDLGMRASITRRPGDDNDRGIECTSNYREPAEVGKSRVIESAPAEKKNAYDLEKRRRCNECYKWYVWMGQPTRANMKSRVPLMPESCDITVADVDNLPWNTGGKTVNVIEMNKIILGKI
jgi:hypothetical protein